MAGIAQDLCDASLANSSRRTYGAAQKSYISFCEAIGAQPVPASEQLLILFVAEASQKVCYSTIRTYLAAVRHMHIARGYKDPLKGALQLELVLRGAKRQKPRSQDSRLPITTWILLKIKKVLQRDPHNWDNIMLWAAVTMAFFAFLRSGELTVDSLDSFDPEWHLTPRDIAVDDVNSPSLLRVHVKGSKTDQTRVGVELFVGRTDNELCPVAAILAYVAIRGQEDGPFFLLSTGKPLSRQVLVKMLKESLVEAGMDCSRFSGHSFRIGAATTALANGVSDATIQTLGRWASESYKRYIRIPRNELAGISSVLVKDTSARLN